MTHYRANHPDRRHKKPKGESTKKQFARLRGESTILWIHNTEDWARIHRPGENVPLVCPDGDCGHPMKAVQRTKPRVTRYLSDMGERHCRHFLPDGGGGVPTDEHLWLQGKVREVCQRLGYEAELELKRADVWVGSNPPYALEVQRVSTDFWKRRRERKSRGMETLWFLPESEKQRDIGRPQSGGDPVFSHPAVRVRYRDQRRPSRSLAWSEVREAGVFGGNSDAVEVEVAVTLWEAESGDTAFKRAKSLSLESFLEQVLRGERHWLPKGELHGEHPPLKTWAGWVSTSDLEHVREARKKRDDARRRQQQIEALRRREEEDRHARETRESAARAAAEVEKASSLRLDEERQKVDTDEHPSALRPATAYESHMGLKQDLSQDSRIERKDAPRPRPGPRPVPWWKKLLRALTRTRP